MESFSLESSDYGKAGLVIIESWFWTPNVMLELRGKADPQTVKVKIQ